MTLIVWSMLAQHTTKDNLAKHRAADFCCSTVYVKRDVDCKSCGADHMMIERRLECTSPSCASHEMTTGDTQCAVQWKIWECPSSSIWCVFGNDKLHSRGAGACNGSIALLLPKKSRNTWHGWIRVECHLGTFGVAFGVRMTFRRLHWDYPRANKLRIALGAYEKKLSRNTRQSVKVMTKEYPYRDGIDAGEAFLFGPEDDDDRFPRIGKGSDGDPFVLGRTTLEMLSKINQLRGEEHFRPFHTVATFKSTDLGYPVLTCGITDRARTYLAAILVVSARIHREYELEFGSVAKVYRQIYQPTRRVDAALGDAERAQFNPLRSVKYLMSFFHVLYNVHKRTRHPATGPDVAVVTGIMDMHYTTSYTEFCTVKDRVLSGWRLELTVRNFADYFEVEWIESRYWRWQIYYSPSTTTNNPCEVVIASVKRHVQRKTSEMCALFHSMITLTEDVGCDVPAPTASIASPNADIKRAAKWMLTTKAVAVIRKNVDTQVRVLHILEVHVDATAMKAMRCLASSVIVGDEETPSLSRLVLKRRRMLKRRACTVTVSSGRRAEHIEKTCPHLDG